MGGKRPEILIANGPDNSLIKPLLYGIEEEEIPFRFIDESLGQTTIQKAYNCAATSQLSVGIAYDDEFVYLHFKNLPVETPLFKVSISDRLNVNFVGANAARLVKGIPFKEIK